MSTLKKILSELTPEKREEIRQNRLKKNKEQSLESQLGYYVGEYIISTHLPTISTDSIRSHNCIIVSEEDSIENKRLEEEWYSTTRYGGNHNGKDENGDKEKWEKYYKHNKFLEQKYLPHKLKCSILPLNVEKVDEFKKGLILSLWDSDMCSYNLNPENIKIDNDKYGYLTIIEFVLNELVND